MPCSCCFPDDVEEKQIFISPSFLARTCRLDHCLKIKFAKSPNSSSSPTPSSLLNLPLECFHNIVQYLDITSMIAIRRTSQDCRAAVDRFLPWQDVVQHAPQALRAVLALETSANTSLIQLHAALTSAHCSYCDDTFAGYISLFECKRACAYCLRNEPTLRPLELRVLINLKSQRNSNLASLSSLPRLKTIPGRYGPYKTRMHRRDIIVLASSVRSLLEKPFSDRENDLINGRANSAFVPHDPFSDGFESYGHAFAPVPGYVNPESPNDIAHRYMSAVEAPFVDPTTKEARTGSRCNKCHLNILFITDQWATGVRQGFPRRGMGEKLADALRLTARLKDCSKDKLEAHQEQLHSKKGDDLQHEEWMKQKNIHVF